MKTSYYVFLLAFTLAACSSNEEGLLGEWEGTTELLNSDGELVESDISCTIQRTSGLERYVVLEVGGVSYTFEAIEDINILSYKNRPLHNDTIENRFITGTAELQFDTLLHFEHDIYAMKNNALLYSDKMVLDMVRK